MPQLYKAKALVVKVAVGPANGNRVARIVRQGAVIPEGVEQDKLDQLEELGLIEKIEAPAETDPEEAEKAEAEAAAKAAAEAEAAAKAEAEAKARAAAAGKSTGAK